MHRYFIGGAAVVALIALSLAYFYVTRPIINLPPIPDFDMPKVEAPALPQVPPVVFHKIEKKVVVVRPAPAPKVVVKRKPTKAPVVVAPVTEEEQRVVAPAYPYDRAETNAGG